MWDGGVGPMLGLQGWVAIAVGQKIPPGLWVIGGSVKFSAPAQAAGQVMGVAGKKLSLDQ